MIPRFCCASGMVLCMCAGFPLGKGIFSPTHVLFLKNPCTFFLLNEMMHTFPT